MISETTKFTRDSIETPFLRTLELKSSDDIRLNEISFKETFFDDSEIVPVDVVSILGNENFISRGAEMIHAFRMSCENYYGKKLSNVTLRRQVGDNNFSNAESATNDVWMVAICYDKNNNVLETHFSSNKNRQKANEYETTWNFNPFVIKTEHKIIEFRITLTEGEVNLNPANQSLRMRSSNIQTTNGKYYISDWKTVNQNNGVENFTTDFKVDLIKYFSGITRHTKDENVHLNYDLKEKINNIPDLEIKIDSTKSEVIAKIDATKSSLESQISGVSVELNGVENEINIIKNDLNGVTDFVQNYEPGFHNTIKITGKTDDGTINARGFELGRDKLNVGFISHISIALINHNYNKHSLGNYYLAAQAFKEGDPEVLTIENTSYSKEAFEITNSTSKYEYDFDDLYISDDVSFVRFVLVSSKTIVPNPSPNVEGIGILRLNVFDYGSNEISNSRVYVLDTYAQKAYTNCELTYDVIKSLSSSNEKTINDVKSHVNNTEIHITSDYKNAISKNFETLENAQKAISKSFFSIEKDVHDGDLEIVEDKISFSSDNKVACQEVYRIQICGQHKVEGTAKLTKIIVPQNTTAADEKYTKDVPLYLVIYGDTTGNDDYVFIGNSINTQKQNKGDKDMVFYFSNENIGDYFKYSLFYAYDVSSIPVIPMTINDCLNTPKMAFDAFNLGSGESCGVWFINGSGNYVAQFPRTFPAEIHYNKFDGENVILHKLNEKIHLSDEQISILNSSKTHIFDEDKHVSHNEKLNITKIREIERNTYDSLGEVVESVLSFSSNVTKPAQGIRKVQICDKHKISGTANLKSIVIPQNTQATEGEYTKNSPLYLVIYGDTTGDNNFVYIAHSQNTQFQIRGGEDMTFIFNYENIGNYHKYRLFYAFATDAEGNAIEPNLTEPDKSINENHYLNEVPLMAFTALEVDNTCSIWPDNGSETKSYTMPLHMYYDTYDGDMQLHKTNPRLHFVDDEKSFLIKDSFSYTPFEDGDVEDNFNSCHGFQLGPKHIKSGLLSQIRIPYKSTSNSEIIGEKYMAVQIFREEDDDTASKNKSLGETYFSTNTHTVVSGVADAYVFNFNNIYIPKSFKYVRFIPTTSTSVAPNGYTVENCAKMALRPIKRNNTTNFDDDGCYVIVGNNNKSSLLTICDLIYDKEKTEAPLKNIVSRTWKVECDESCFVDATIESVYANLTSKEKIVDVNIILHSTESIYNPKENTMNPFELRTFVFTFNAYVSIDDVKDSIGDVMKKGDIYGYPLIYPIHI